MIRAGRRNVSGKKRPKKILAFDWDARTLRVVHAHLSKRAAKIDRLLSVPVPSDVDPMSPEQMGKLLRRVLEQEDISTRHAIVDVPRDQVILNTLSLPVLAPDVLPNIVGIQIAKQLPYAVTDAVIDFAEAPHAADAATGDVLVAAVRREIVSLYEGIFNAAGLKLDRVGLRPYATTLATRRLLRHGLPERVLFIDVRPTLTEINVLRNSLLTFSRAASVHIPEDLSDRRKVPVPRADSSGPELTLVGAAEPGDELVEPGRSPLDTVISSLVVEVTRSIEAYRATDPGAKMDHCVIGGDLGIEEPLAEALQQRLGITAEIYNPASSFGWEPDEGAGASAFAATLGLVIGYVEEDTLQFDFLHPKKVVTATERRLRKAPIAAAALVLLVAGAGGIVAATTKPQRDKLAAVERRIAELEKEKRDNDHEKFLKLIQEIKSFDGEQFVWVDELHDIIGYLPTQEQMVISQIEMTQKRGEVVLKTRAKKRDTATDTIGQLNSFSREGKDLPRFKATMGGQQEKPGEDYPFLQDLRIRILSDETKKKPASASSQT